MPAQAAAIMRAARVVLFSQIAGIAAAGPVAFYVLGFSTHPHHVLTATLTAGIVVVMNIPVMFWLYRDPPTGICVSRHPRRPVAGRVEPARGRCRDLP